MAHFIRVSTCGWPVKLCDLSLTRIILSALEVSSHEKALYNCHFLVLKLHAFLTKFDEVSAKTCLIVCLRCSHVFPSAMHESAALELTVAGRNKWSKTFDKRPHCRRCGLFMVSGEHCGRLQQWRCHAVIED